MVGEEDSMKKIIFCISGILCLSAGLHAIHFEAGFFYGQRTVNDTDIKNIYGNGAIYFPCVGIIWKGLILGGGYEGGYSRDGEIGMFNEATTLSVTGLEFFIGYQVKLKMTAPYVKVGYGSYSYKQTIESLYLGEFKVDHKKSAITVSGGLKIHPLKNLFLAGEVKYVPLKVKPFDEEVDLSGLRLMAGIGFSL